VADGIILEGFIATNASTGISVTSNNNTLKGNNASYNIGTFVFGIELRSSSNNTLIGNNANYNGDYNGSWQTQRSYGIYLDSSRNNTLMATMQTRTTSTASIWNIPAITR